MESVPPHPKPKWELEQYLTPSYIASTIVWTAYVRGEIENKRVADLGCGTGRFCLGISALGGHCTCVDIDRDSLEVAKSTLRTIDAEAEFVEADCNSFNGRFDTVIQNPPFGNAVRGIDLNFLRKALEIANTVYSIHRSNPKSREIIIREANSMGFKVETIELAFPLLAYYPWHREKVHKILVDIYSFRKVS
ncbi:MAG: METTL5 family protein [Metallosphaera sp.]